jgi:hypothetical protein
VGKRSDEPWRLPKGYAEPGLWDGVGGFLARVPLLRCLEVEVERDKKPKERRKGKKAKAAAAEEEEEGKKKKEGKRRKKKRKAEEVQEEAEEEEGGGEEGEEENAVMIVLQGEEEGGGAGAAAGAVAGAAAAAAGGGEEEQEGDGGGSGGKKGKKKRTSSGKAKATATATAKAKPDTPPPRPDELADPLLLLKGLRGLSHLTELRLEICHLGPSVQGGLARVLSRELPPCLEELIVVVNQVATAVAPLLASITTPPGLPRLRALRIIGEGPAPSPDEEAAHDVVQLLLALTSTRTPRLEEVALLGGLPCKPLFDDPLHLVLSPLMLWPSNRWWEEQAPKGLVAVEIDDDDSFSVLKIMMERGHPLGMAMVRVVLLAACCAAAGQQGLGRLRRDGIELPRFTTAHPFSSSQHTRTHTCT